MPKDIVETTVNSSSLSNMISTDVPELLGLGGEFLVNEETNNSQYEPNITALTNGQFVVTWYSYDGVDDTSDTGIKARIFNADGSEAVGEFLVNEETNDSQYFPDVTALANGQFVVTWHSYDRVDDTSSSGVKARIFNADGSEAVSEFLVNEETDSSQYYSEVATLANGQFVVTWFSYDGVDDTSSSGVKARIFNADGSEAVSEFLVNEETNDMQYGAYITALANDQFVVTWISGDGVDDTSGTGIKARIFNADGSEAVSEFLVNEETNSGQYVDDVTVLANGQFVVTWHSYDGVDDTSDTGIKARIFNADGSEAVGEFLVNEETYSFQSGPTSTALANGQFVVAWYSGDGVDDKSGSGIKARIFNADGSEAVSEFLVNEETNGNQSRPEVTALANGQFVVTWESYDGVDDTSYSGIKARIFNADGSPVIDPTVVTTTNDIVDATDGVTSLREALAFADSDPDATTITFDDSLSGHIITLDGTELTSSTDVTINGDINGDSIADVTLSGDGASRVLRVTDGALTLESLTIADGDAGSNVGGGIWVNTGASVHLTSSTVTNNAALHGGGLYIDDGATVTLTLSTVSDNAAESDGGGLFNAGALSLTDSTISGNTAIWGAGIDNFGSATATAVNSTLSGNSASKVGGAILNGSLASLVMTNFTISGNTAGASGGGIGNGGLASLTNGTISGNTAVENGGGIRNWGDMTFTNSIALGNDAPIGTDIQEANGTFISVNSLTGADGETAADVFAVLDGAGGLLADNGGPVLTITLKADVANPALDSGDDAAAPATDAAGQLRFDVPGLSGNGSNISDLGALELEILTLFSGDEDANEILGTEFADTIFGNGGFDTLYGLEGDDFIHGGDGNDLVYGQDGADTLRGGNAADRIDGGAQNDTLRGDAGNDVLHGGDDNDLLLGGLHNDRLFGDAGDDKLRGGDGEDWLIGGLGADFLYGGTGADRFIFHAAADSPDGANEDRILDFTSGEDLIGLRDIILGTFDFIGTTAFSGTASEVRIIETPNGHSRIHVDVDGDALADMRVFVLETTGLTANDFVL